MMKKYLISILFFLVPFIGLTQNGEPDTVEIRMLEMKNDTAVNGNLSPMREYFDHKNGKSYKYFRSYQTALYYYMGKMDNKREGFTRNEVNTIKDVVYISDHKTKRQPIGFIIDKGENRVGTILKH